MKKEKTFKKFLELEKRTNAIMNGSEDLGKKLALIVATEAKGADSTLVALYGLAKAVIRVTDACEEAGHKNALRSFLTLLEADLEADAMLNIKHSWTSQAAKPSETFNMKFKGNK